MRLVAPLVVDNSASRRLVVDYFAFACVARHADHRAARRRLLRLRRASGCLNTSRGSSLVVDYFAYTARLVTRLVAPLVVDYSASRRLVVDYFTSAAGPRASARRAARDAARHRLLHLLRASGCFGMSRCLSRDSSSTTSPRAGSSSTTSPTPRVRLLQHVARFVA
jgi:hypothetical protein